MCRRHGRCGSCEIVVLSQVEWWPAAHRIGRGKCGMRPDQITARDVVARGS